MDWRDGFLFVGNQLALDFVNTWPVIEGQPAELLPDGAALARWLGAARIISEREAVRLARQWSSSAFTLAVQNLRDWRESLRKVVLEIEEGASPPAAFIKDLNRMLIRHPAIDQVVNAGSQLGRRRRFGPEVPDDVFAPLADATADLITDVERARIRKCPACVLHFYDTSKRVLERGAA